jgi:hypothetical protein
VKDSGKGDSADEGEGANDELLHDGSPFVGVGSILVKVFYAKKL